MNLKKEAGKSSVANECVYCYSEKDLQHIIEEIRIIDPDIIIACGTAVFAALDKIVFNGYRVDTDRKLVFNKKF